jgi:biopolymer transport protein ExbD
MPWRLRHEGSPQPIPQLVSTQQIFEGLRDGVYASTDEVRAPGGPKWEKLESHPEFAELCQTLQQMEDEKLHEPEDNHIDMNPLIDVCLVLLVFFILATTLAVMQRVISLPRNQLSTKQPVQLKPEDLEKYIMLVIERKGGTTTFEVNNAAADANTLERELDRQVQLGKSELILDVRPGVDMDAYTFALDKARTARVTKIMTKASEQQIRAAGGNTPAKSPPAAPGKAPPAQ